MGNIPGLDEAAGRSRGWIRPWSYGGLVIVGLLVSVWLLNVSRPGTRVEGCQAGCATVGERRNGPLRIVSLNALHGFPRFEHLPQRLDLLADEIHRQDADIVCLQEVPWTLRLGSAAQYLAERTGLNYLYLRANGNRRAILLEEGEVILSDYPLQDAAALELQPRAAPFEHRVALSATAATPWGDVPIFVTHLTNGDPQINQRQAMSLASFVSASGSGPTVVAGDFNATEDSPPIKALSDLWIDAYRAASPGTRGLTCCIDDLAADRAEPLEERIDYVFLVPGQGARVISSRRVLEKPRWTGDGWQWASDHVGLLIAVEIEQ